MSDFIPQPQGGWVAVELQGTGDLRRRLGRVRADLDDFEPLWEMISEVMVEHELDWFDTEGEGTWPPLSDKYLERKMREGFVPDILIREGRLLESLTDPAEAASVASGRSTLGTFTGQAFTWGTSEPTGEYHTEGRTDPNFMPPRPPLVVTQKLRARVHDAAEDWLSDVLERSGFGEEG